MSQARTVVFKRALVRDPSVPPGQPATLTLRCGCGEVLMMTNAPAETTCRCGIVYGPQGWVLRDPVVEAACEAYVNEQAAKLHAMTYGAVLPRPPGEP